MSAQTLAGRARPAGSVRAVVRNVHFGLQAARLAESLLLGLAAALVTLAAGAASGLALDALGGLAALTGLCAAACWWLEHPRAAGGTARALDQRLRHHGALLTAYELELRARTLAPMEELVRARVLARLRLDEAVRALFPPLFVPLAAPAAAALLLAFARAGGPSEEQAAPDFSALAGGLERELSMPSLSEESTGIEGEGSDGGLSRAQAREIFAALHARARLPYQAADWRRDPGELLARVEELDRELAALAARAERDSELAGRIAAARPWLDALRRGLERADPAGAGEGSGAEAGMGGSSRGTIGGSPPAVASATPAPSPSSSTVAVPESYLGTQAGSWWPAEYDGLVARWVELSRAERAPDEQR